MIIVKYKFNPSIYSNLLPEFNSAFTSYTKSDVNNGDGTITRTIESTSLPTRIKFGYRDDTTNTKVAASSLLEVIELNTDNVNTTRDMFRYCTNLVNVNTTNWNFSGVTDARSMFTSCPSLTSLDLNNWNTSKVTNMNYMFGGCTSLTSLDLSNWDTSNVTDMYYMFYECSSLTQLDLSNWNTSKVTNMSYMFDSCTSLASLNISNWNTSSAVDMSYMFNSCSSLTSLDLNNWDTSNVTDMNDMFYGCSSLTSLNINNWNTSKVTDMGSMFDRCSVLTSLDINNWDTSKVTSIRNMFSRCSVLTSLDLSNWDTSNVTDMNYVFENCPSLTQLNLKNWDTRKVTGMRWMFRDCSELTSLDISKWNTSKVTDMSSMFRGCTKLTSLNISNWNTSQVTDISNMFSSCTNLTSLDLSNWNTSKITTAYLVFYGCSSLTSLNVSNWDTSKITNMESIFDDCSSLTSLDVSNWNISNVTNSYGIFSGCSSLRKVNLKYVNQSTVSKIHEKLPDRTNTTPGYILSLISLTSDKNWETLKFSHNEVYLPQPLRKIGNMKDKLYWDYDKGHYCIEQNVGQVVLDGSEDEDWNITGSSSIDRINTMAFRLSDPMMGSVYNIKCDKFITCSRENSCYSTDNEGVEGIGSEPYYLCLGIKKSKLPTQDVAGLRQWLSSNPTTVLYVLVAPNIIDLPEMNKKLSYDTYLPNTSVDVTNLPLQPYKLLLEDDTVRYKSTIEPSTLYTIQFNCLAKSTTNLTLDLGGTRVTVAPIIGVNHVQITTPSELTSDRLFLIGTGIIVNEVIVNKGNMNQYTKYFDGEQGVGELQEDGSYIIRISTDNYTNLWEGDL